MPAVASEIRWGTGFDNVVHFDPMPTSTDELPQGLDDVVTWSDPAPGSRRARNDAGVTDSWERATDLKMAGRARFFGGASWRSTIQPFLKWAGSNAFRFIPDRRYPNFYIESYLDSPFEDRRPQLEASDGSQSIEVVLRNQAVDFGLAMRGLMFEYAPGLSITEPSSMLAAFTRATVARFHSRDGIVTQAATGTLRDRHFIAGARATLLEKASTNRCLQSENFGTTWTVNGTPTRVAAAHTASGVTLDLIGDDSAGSTEYYLQGITIGANGDKSVTIYIKRGTSPAASGSRVLITDTTAGQNRLLVTITFNGAGIPSVAVTTGAFYGYEEVEDGVYRIYCATTTVTGANNHDVVVQPAGTAAEQGNLYAGGVQVEDGAFPTSYVPTTTATVTRNADSLPFPYGYVPQAMTLYVKFIERGTIGTTAGRVLQIGAAADTNPQLVIFANGGFYSVAHNNGSSSVVSTLAAAPSWGNVVELHATLGSDGSVAISQSINGAAATSASTSSPLAFAAAWSDVLLWLNSVGSTGAGINALQVVRVSAGPKTLAEMRAA